MFRARAPKHTFHTLSSSLSSLLSHPSILPINFSLLLTIYSSNPRTIIFFLIISVYYFFGQPLHRLSSNLISPIFSTTSLLFLLSTCSNHLGLFFLVFPAMSYVTHTDSHIYSFLTLFKLVTSHIYHLAFSFLFFLIQIAQHADPHTLLLA